MTRDTHTSKMRGTEEGNRELEEEYLPLRRITTGEVVSGCTKGVLQQFAKQCEGRRELLAVLCEVAPAATGEAGIGNITDEDIGIVALEIPVKGLTGDGDHLHWEKR